MQGVAHIQVNALVGGWGGGGLLYPLASSVNTHAGTRSQTDPLSVRNLVLPLEACSPAAAEPRVLKLCP